MCGPLTVLTCDVVRVHQPETRRAQYKELVEALGRQLGDRYFQLTEQFHHVFWTGDLNYRMVSLRASDVLDMLEQSKVPCHPCMWRPLLLACDALNPHSCEQVPQLYSQYDGMVIDREKYNLWVDWEEPPMFPNMYPTYKKCVSRTVRLACSPPQRAHVRCRRVYLCGVQVRSATRSDLSHSVGGVHCHIQWNSDGG